MMKMQNHKNSNIKIKVTCLFFAFFMWVYVMSELDPVDTRVVNSVTVTLSNIDELESSNLVLSPEQNLIANVQIRGRRSVIVQKLKSGFKLQTTIQDAVVGLNSAQIILLGDNSDISYTISPSVLDINLEEKITVEKKISIKSIGNLSADYYIDTIKLSRDNVYVSGPSSLVEKIDKVEVDLDLENNSQDFSKLSNIKLLDNESNEISGLTLDIPSVVVSVNLKKEKIVPVKANIESDTDNISIFELKLNPETVKIQGSPGDIDLISEIETKQIYLSELSDKENLKVELSIPNNIYSSTREVTLTSKVNRIIEHKEFKFTYSVNEIEILNNTDSDKFIINDIENVQVNFSSIDDITKDDIKLFVDSQNISDNRVNISYSSNRNIDNITIIPESIEIIRGTAE